VKRIPVDRSGNARGHSAVDEAAISGEPFLSENRVGDEVFAGTVNLNGSLAIAVTKEQKDTLFQRIIDLVEAAKA